MPIAKPRSCPRRPSPLKDVMHASPITETMNSSGEPNVRTSGRTIGTDTARVAAAFRARDIAYLKADWTRRDPEITADLARFGRAGVPLYLLYPAAGGPPQVLPSILTEGLVLKAAAGA